MSRLFATEADLVRCYCAQIDPARWSNNPDRAPAWVAYHETAGWDLLLVHPSGAQVGVEAKLSLNAKVLDQALPGHWADTAGPDYRAVLVPQDGLQLHMKSIALHLGIVIITCRPEERDGRHVRIYARAEPDLPDEAWEYRMRSWPNWCPSQRCRVPDYVPDVSGGHAAPVTLTAWKIDAIKLVILLDRRGFVTRADMKALKLSPSRWTDHHHGFLSPAPERGGYVRNSRTPDFKAQHPLNWAQIEADFATWSADLLAAQALTVQPDLLAPGAVA